MLDLIEKPIALVFVVFFFAALNSVMYALTSAMGSPTVIAGLGWALDVPILGSAMITSIVAVVLGGVLRFITAQKEKAKREQAEHVYSELEAMLSGK